MITIQEAADKLDCVIRHGDLTVYPREALKKGELYYVWDGNSEEDYDNRKVVFYTGKTTIDGTPIFVFQFCEIENPVFELTWENYRPVIGTALSGPETDWSQVPRDTWVVVWDYKDGRKVLRHFAWKNDEDDDPFVAFVDGYSSHNSWRTTTWRYCRLATFAEIEQGDRGDYEVRE